MASRTELRQEWEKRLEDFQASGQTATAWCSEHGIHMHRFWYWSRKLRTSLVEKSGERVRWLSVELNESAIGTDFLTIQVGRARIEVHEGFNPMLLRQVIQVLADAQ